MAILSILRDIRALFTKNDAVNDLWYILAASAITSLNHPEDIEPVYALVEQSIDESVKLSQSEKEEAKIHAVLRLREGILKSFIASGFPKTINGLKHLNIATPEPINAKLPKTPFRKEDSWEAILRGRERGKALFAKIYDKHTERVLTDMHTFYPDLGQVAIHQLYGPVISNTSLLSGKESSLVLVTGLKAQDIAAQLRGHTYGALHQGATREDLSNINAMVNMLCKHYGVSLPKAKL
ncbi:hypothetical protein BDB00DRAFT_607840 [Zychaea mexicana]|uniref:uncharacterized protein n=1 Tax=Zychaea mexicana TaxID=64656 RepID=UPI0022FE5C35|nr:uncharacterized protein BDB00DRAFT_607840 [Zychaea mexicana]KAI9489554.1 hypothetical protein BDB00DRAFT_607840 [Zychaea mexicana]